LDAGAHVTSVGMTAEGREVDAGLVAAARIFVESRAAALAPFPAGANDLTGVAPEALTEIGEVIAGERRGRETREELTLYKSVGVGVMDAAAAALVLRAAREQGRGVEVAL
jgi:ornithine cyclodeaminase